jgi:nucleosome binding factor SPN SPT16 subunit
VEKMEEIIDQDLKMSHESIAQKVESVIANPAEINIKVSKDFVESCYFPIVQSGGKYDIRVSAQSNSDNLAYDIIICSLGARFKNYCANISRTFMVDAPPKVEQTYATLLNLYDKCLEKMIPGNELNEVMSIAHSFLSERDKSLLDHLPKTLGFAIGLEFKDSVLSLNGTNSNKFEEGMVFCLSVGFHKVPLTPADKARASPAVQKLNDFSLLLSDTVLIQKSGPAEILTKSTKDFGSVSYNLNDKVTHIQMNYF